MLGPKTLTKKNSFIKENGDLVVDLTKSSFQYVTEPRVINRVLVTNDLEMRADLISKLVYGDDSGFDYILKFNGISNPFSIETGDVLYIPDYFEMNDSFKTPSVDNNDKSKKQVNDVATPQEDKKMQGVKTLLKSLEDKKKQLKSGIAPNVNKPGDQNIKFSEGKIIFGEDVSKTNQNNCPETLSRAKVKEKLLRSKIV